MCFLRGSPSAHAVLRNSWSDKYLECESLLRPFCKAKALCQSIALKDAASLLAVEEEIELLMNFSLRD